MNKTLSFYQASWKKDKVLFTNDFFYRKNISGGSNSSDADYAASRVGADSSWDAFSYIGLFGFHVGEWRVQTNLRAQVTDEPLISGEQFGVGGQNTVRGFSEREVTGDSGVYASLELWTPKWRSFDFLGFLDYGDVSRENPLPGEIDAQNISSTGIGIRWTSPSNNWSFKLDLAHVLEGVDRVPDATQDGDNRAHFSLVYRR